MQDYTIDIINEESVLAENDWFNEMSQLLEFNISETIQKIKENLKKYILRLIDKAQEFLKKGKDNKVKQKINELLQTLKNKLTDVDKADSKEKLDDIKNQVKDTAEYLMSTLGVIKTTRSYVDTFSSKDLSQFCKQLFNDHKEDKSHDYNNLQCVVFYFNKDSKEDPIIGWCKKNQKPIPFAKKSGNIIVIILYDKKKEVYIEAVNCQYENIDSNLQAKFIENDSLMIVTP